MWSISIPTLLKSPLKSKLTHDTPQTLLERIKWQSKWQHTPHTHPTHPSHPTHTPRPPHTHFTSNTHPTRKQHVTSFMHMVLNSSINSSTGDSDCFCATKNTTQSGFVCGLVWASTYLRECELAPDSDMRARVCMCGNCMFVFGGVIMCTFSCGCMCGDCILLHDSVYIFALLYVWWLNVCVLCLMMCRFPVIACVCFCDSVNFFAL